MPPVPHQRNACEGLLASIDVAESNTVSDGGLGLVIEIIKQIVSVRTAPQLAKIQTEPAPGVGLAGPAGTQHEQELCDTCMWYGPQLNC